ncbi:MAG: hypothetical protein FRX49_04407 [Trebouxia sp. A1-2]|nr:MAG: hypothetical protein FRX49_04407 [Trebouxia sp. A1-2]
MQCHVVSRTGSPLEAGTGVSPAKRSSDRGPPAFRDSRPGLRAFKPGWLTGTTKGCPCESTSHKLPSLIPTTTTGPDHAQDMFTLQLCLAVIEERHNPHGDAPRERADWHDRHSGWDKQEEDNETEAGCTRCVLALNMCWRRAGDDIGRARARRDLRTEGPLKVGLQWAELPLSAQR